MSPVSPIRQPHSVALSVSQQLQRFLRDNAPTGALGYPIPFLSTPESGDVWMEHEKLLVSCLRTGDDRGAFLCLERLIGRFGATNERVMGLRGLYQEAVAEDETALRQVLLEYDDVLTGDVTNTPIAKRRIALLCTLNRSSEAIEALNELLESSPTDIEAWAELADLYAARGLFSQAIFCLEEVLLVAPNAWNVHARLGELLYVSASPSTNVYQAMVDATGRFCRSIELCNDYIRGYYGLKMITAVTPIQASDRLLSLLDNGPRQTQAPHHAESHQLSVQRIRQLNEQATLKLAEATKTGTGIGQNRNELVAATRLLNKGAEMTVR